MDMIRFAELIFKMRAAQKMCRLHNNAANRAAAEVWELVVDLEVDHILDDSMKHKKEQE